MNAGCRKTSIKDIQNVGVLFPYTINKEIWSVKGYKGLLSIQSTFDINVYYEENVKTLSAAKKAISLFKNKGVNLIFGQGDQFGNIFMALKDEFPNIHFVCFNGSVEGDNLTSIHFEGEAMGFFAGEIAARMSTNQSIGVIAAFPWQPEVEGFVEGAIYQNPMTEVHFKYVQSWNDTDKALRILDEMIQKKYTDVIYSIGNGFNIPVIQAVKAHGLYAIGYISDQSDLGKRTVLTSTVEHVDQLYKLVAKEFNAGKLKSGNLYFDFQEGVISMGTFSPVVPKDYADRIKEQVTHYKKTGELP